MSLIIWIKDSTKHFESRPIGQSAKIQFQGHIKGMQEEFCDIVYSICSKSMFRIMSQWFSVAKCTHETPCRCVFWNHGIPKQSSQWLGRATYLDLMHSRRLSVSAQTLRSASLKVSFPASYAMHMKSKYCQNVASLQS